MTFDNDQSPDSVSFNLPLEKQNDSKACRNGDLVKITKGPLKGLTGWLSTYTNDGFYFVWEKDNSQETGHTLIYRGPFFRHEFELLS